MSDFRPRPGRPAGPTRILAQELGVRPRAIWRLGGAKKLNAMTTDARQVLLNQSTTRFIKRRVVAVVKDTKPKKKTKPRKWVPGMGCMACGDKCYFDLCDLCTAFLRETRAEYERIVKMRRAA